LKDWKLKTPQITVAPCFYCLRSYASVFCIHLQLLHSKHKKIKSSLYWLNQIFGCHEWTVLISAVLRQGPHIKVAAVASRWQRVGDLIGSEFEPHQRHSHTKGRLTTCAI